MKRDTECTPQPDGVAEVKKSKSNRAKVSLMEAETEKTDIINYVQVEINEVEDDSITLSKSLSHEAYTNYVDIVSDSESGNKWIVFTDMYTAFPLFKGISNVLGKSGLETFLTIPDKNEPTVIINWDAFNENFSKIMTLPMMYTDDEDYTNFLVAYTIRENYNTGDLSQKEEITPVDVFCYIIRSRMDDVVLYFADADIYTSRNNFVGDSDPEKDAKIFVNRPFAEPPHMRIILDVNVVMNKKLAKKTTVHLLPIKSSYTFSELGFYRPSYQEVSERISENEEYVTNMNIYRAYNGTGLIPGFFGPREIYSNGRVIVDAGALYFVDPDLLGNLFGSVGIHGDHNNDVITKDNSLKNGTVAYSNNDYMSMTKYEICYDLGKKMWFVGNRDNLSDIKFRKDAFEKLQLDEQKKNIIKKICSANERTNKNIDLIDGKGGGNIFLLHGTPGTGKTLTAEAISELLEKPLYKVNISEFEGMRDLEKGIEQALRYAERWDATLLIDEADVALERRDSNNIERNAIVAVFLRLIEYYTGTMFLTSNRAEQFDEAFKSRITFAIHYNKPSDTVRGHIWKNILENLNTDISEEDIINLSRYDINGRQIKNIINTASYMSDNGEVLKEHVYTVLEQTMEFERFIKDRN